MVQILVTLGAFCLACLVFLINRLSGGTWIPEDQFSTANIAITTAIAFIVEGALIGYQVYKKKGGKTKPKIAQPPSDNPDLPRKDDEYDFRPKKRNKDDE